MNEARIVADMSSEDYHAHKALSRSALWKFRQLPYKYWYEYLSGQFQQKSETDALKMGSLTHTMILEPNLFNDTYFVMNKVNRATSAGKKAYSDALMEAGTRMLITSEEFEIADNMRKSVYCNQVAVDILNNSLKEHSIFWHDEATGLQLKARPDILTNAIIADVKTTLDASSRSFQLSAYQEGYFLQAAMQYDAASAIGFPVEKFVFICVEKKQPYSTAVYMIDDEGIIYGQQLLRKLLDDYKTCQDNNNWPDYGIQTLTIPKWASMEQNYEQ